MICWNLLRGDVRQQYRYGFYWLYLFFTLFYVFALRVMPAEWQSTVSQLIILTDPVLIGFVFMGAIILFERSEHVVNALSVTPIKIWQYLFSKVISLTLIALLSSEAILLLSSLNQTIWTLVAIALGSTLFTLIGVILSSQVSSLNGFVLLMVPTMIFAILPPVLYLCGLDGWWQAFQPCVAILRLMQGMEPIGTLCLLVLVLLAWIVPVAWLAAKSARLIMSTTIDKL